ncbi:MAG: c-type cytochrome [Amylibacter sp.]|nr:c-type cytochrome [Amylibacter sp.]
MSKFLKVLIAVSFIASPVMAGSLGLGRAATPDEVAAWNTDIRPDGMGLPVGSGSVADGEEIFAEKCAACHGDFGEAVGRWPVLAGGHGSLSDARPVKTVGSYWPYLSTVYDYVYRAMPFGNAASLTADETYAIVAYIMYVNDTVDDESFVLSNKNFLDIPQENVDGFFMDDRDKVEYPKFSQVACMTDCKATVEITKRAAVVDVTPEETAAAAAEAKMKVATAEAAEPEATPALDAELVAAGKKVFKKCKSCHKVGEGAKNGVGPQLNGILGRAAASQDGFKYSKAMKAEADAGLVWDEAKLRTFLKKPKAMIKKTKMSFNGLKKDKQIDGIIEYLKSVSQ